MKLSDLTAYAKEKYNILEKHNDLFKCFVLSYSFQCRRTRKTELIALLMRQWDMEAGMEIERCDIRCGQPSILELGKPYLSFPIRMFGPDWVGVTMNHSTEPDIVFKLLDQAIVFASNHPSCGVPGNIGDYPKMGGMGGGMNINIECNAPDDD